jgi:nucleoside-diphosphate-sugar epimerase
MNNNSGRPTCLITGAHGYLGNCIKAKFQQEGWNVVDLVRNPKPQEVKAEKAILFTLGEGISPQTLQGAKALVHCAYDFSLRDWKDIREINVLGTEKLFGAAKTAGVEKRVFISSMSAYEDCKSLYGKAKLEAEKLVPGALSLRPGLIYGNNPQGMVGKLVKQVRNSSVLPIFYNGCQVLYLSHEEDLSQVVYDYASGRISAPAEPVIVAHEKGWTLRSILEELARSQGKKARFINVPWQLLWLVIKCCELCRIPIDFRSDSLISLLNQNLHPSFAPAHQLKLSFRPFEVEKLTI